MGAGCTESVCGGDHPTNHCVGTTCTCSAKASRSSTTLSPNSSSIIAPVILCKAESRQQAAQASKAAGGKYVAGSASEQGAAGGAGELGKRNARSSRRCRFPRRKKCWNEGAWHSKPSPIARSRLPECPAHPKPLHVWLCPPLGPLLSVSVGGVVKSG